MDHIRGNRSNRSRRRWPALLACLVAPAAWAQIGPVQLPQLPQITLPPLVTGAVGDIGNDLGQLVRGEVRQLRVRELLRTQRTLLERDPNGNAILRAQFVALSPSAEALAAALTAGFTVAREQALEGLDARLVILRAPARLST